MGSYEPHSIPTLMKRNADEVGDLPALKTKDPKTGDEVRLTKTNYLDQDDFGIVCQNEMKNIRNHHNKL